MANTLRFKRGLVATIPTALAGEPLFTTDTFDLYIGNGTGNTRFQKYIASGATTQILRGDGSLYTFPLAISSPSAGQVLKYNGTSWVNDSDAGITGSLTTNYLPKATGATTLGNSLIWDNGTTIGINTTSVNSNEKLRIDGGRLVVLGGTDVYQLKLAYNNATAGFWLGSPSANVLAFYNDAGTQRAIFDSSGRLGIAKNSPTNPIHIGTAANSILLDGLKVDRDPSTTSSAIFNAFGGATNIVSNSGATSSYSQILFRQSDNTTTNEISRFTTLGNLHIGTFTSDSGEKLQVTGTMKVTGASSFGGNITSSLNIISNNGTVDNRLSWSSTPAGVVGTISNHPLEFYTNGGVKMLLSASGNLGLGVTPSAWASGYKALQVLNLSLFGTSSLDLNLGSNVFVDSVGYKYIGNGFASLYNQYLGKHYWNTAANNTSGAGAAITFTQAMTLDASGNLMVGPTSTTAKLDVQTTGQFIANLSTSNANGGYLSLGRNSALSIIGSYFSASGGGGSINADALFLRSSNGIGFGSAGAGVSMWLTTLQNLVVGSVSDSGERLQVTGTAKITGTSTFGDYITQTSAATQIILNRTGGTTYGAGVKYQTSGTNNWVVGTAQAIVGTDYSIYNYGLGSGALLITYANNYVGIGTNSPQAKFVVSNGGAQGIEMGYSATYTANYIESYNRSTNAATDLVYFLSGTAKHRFYGGGSERMILDSSGNLAVDSTTLYVDATANEVGIGTNTPNSVLQIVGSVSKSISDVKTANYTATASDHTILCSAASGGFTITLPAASGIAGRIYVIKKTNASSGVNSVTVDGNASETIDGSASINLSCKSSVTLQCDGSNWHILSLYTDTSCL